METGSIIYLNIRFQGVCDSTVELQICMNRNIYRGAGGKSIQVKGKHQSNKAAYKHKLSLTHQRFKINNKPNNCQP